MNKEVQELTEACKRLAESCESLAKDVKDLVAIGLKGQQAQIEGQNQNLDSLGNFLNNMVVGGIQSLEFNINAMTAALVDKGMLTREELVATREAIINKQRALFKAQGIDIDDPTTKVTQEQLDAVLGSLYDSGSEPNE